MYGLHASSFPSLPMFVRMSDDVFARFYGENLFLFNRVNWASSFIANATILKSFITRKSTDFDVVVHKVASESSLSVEGVSVDLRAVLLPLISDGYFDVETSCAGGDEVRDSGEMLSDAVSCKQTKDTTDEREAPLDFLFQYLREHPTPYELCIDLTQACTEKCVHCYAADHKLEHLGWNDVVRVLDEFKAMNGLKVTLTGGECMLHPDFKSILKYAAKSDFVISVLSNLTLCDGEMAWILKDSHVAIVQTSLYGMKESQHERITQRKGSLKETLSGIQRLKDVGVQVQIHCPVMRQNLDGYQAVVEFGRKMRLKVTCDASLIARADHSDCNRECALADAELKGFLRQAEGFVHFGTDAGDVDGDACVCDMGIMKLCLGANGDYYPCNGCHGYKLGNCRISTLQEVWNGSRMRCLRDMRIRDFQRCIRCESRMFCNVCPARNFNATGSLTEPDPSLCRLAKCRRQIAMADER